MQQKEEEKRRRRRVMPGEMPRGDAQVGDGAGDGVKVAVRLGLAVVGSAVNNHNPSSYLCR